MNQFFGDILIKLNQKLGEHGILIYLVILFNKNEKDYYIFF